ncbi:EAL domain-containing protein [Ureibacillus sp. NPDC094379]
MFSIPEYQDFYILQGEYSVKLIVLSVIVACCASYAALFMNQRIQQDSFFTKSFWLFLSSLAMGLGIWSMHFIGMSAFMLPILMKYDLFLTLLSILPAIIASYAAFHFANKTNQSHTSYLMVGLFMGIGISSMHYLGMSAMKLEARYYYKPWIFIFSILIAVVVSYIAMYVFSTLKKYTSNQFIKLTTAVILGLAISSMHYIGMASVVFYVDEPVTVMNHSMHHMDMPLLIIMITIGIFALFIFAAATSSLDRYVEYRLNYFDSLTLFPNQRQFEKGVNNLKSAGTVAIIHIHELENWISRYGYSFGDKIIKAVGDTINENKTDSSKIFRIDGNRFVIFSPEEHHTERVKESVEDILSTLTNSLTIDDYAIVVEMVCAISSSSEKTNVLELFSNCMAVLLHSSIRYKHEVIEYNPQIHTYNLERQIEEDIERAMKENELFIVYQPKVDVHSKKVAGVEALVRWQHPKLGNISPAVFIPVLEKSGKIFEVTNWIIDRVCQQISQWKQENVPFELVAVNIPGSYMTSPKLYNVINVSLEHYQIDSRQIELEITETSVVHDMKNAITAIEQFRKMGISVALDDFGTGLSSLSYLKQMPISTIKIDKSFVDDVPYSEKDSAVLSAIITLSQSLNLKVVIEGVETKEQVNFIGSMVQTPIIQGYYFSPPLSSKDLANWISERAQVPNR